MDNQNLAQIFEHYIARFYELNNPTNMEYYKWEIAAQFHPMLDKALAADNNEFPSKLSSVVLLTEQTIDNRYELSFHALVDYAIKEPDAVRAALKQLLRFDNDDLNARMVRFSEFLDFCNKMLQKYNPDSWRYRAGIRLPMMITGYYDPAHYYLYKSSQAHSYAECVGFYDSWGSGTDINLNIYHRMCNELISEIKKNEALLKINQQRYSFSSKPMHPDEAYHLLAFDIIFCSTVYNLYKGIQITPIDPRKRKEILEKRMQAEKLAEQQSAALERAAQLDKARAFFTERLSVGNRISHKVFKDGIITGIPSQQIVEAAFLSGTKKLKWKDCILSGFISFKTEDNADVYDDMVQLIREENGIVSDVRIAEQKLKGFEEFLTD